MARMEKDPPQAIRTRPQGGYLAKGAPKRCSSMSCDRWNRFPPRLQGHAGRGGISSRSTSSSPCGPPSPAPSTSTGRPPPGRAGDGSRPPPWTRGPLSHRWPAPGRRVGRRVGETDLLLRVGEERNGKGRWPYVAVDVKNHIVRDVTDGHVPEDHAEIADVLPGWRPAVPIPVTARCRYDDLFQLAHYQRLLEACGHEADEGRWGGIMASGPDWPGTTSMHRAGGRRSTSINSRPGRGRPWTPTRCLRLPAGRGRRRPRPPPRTDGPPPGRAHSHSRLRRMRLAGLVLSPPGGDGRSEPPAGDGPAAASAPPPTGCHRSPLLAGLDDRTARLVDAGVDLDDLIGRAARRGPADTHRPRHPPTGAPDRRPGPRRCPAGRRLKALDRRTLSYVGSGMGDLAGQIDRVRARIGPHPAYRRRGSITWMFPGATSSSTWTWRTRPTAPTSGVSSSPSAIRAGRPPSTIGPSSPGTRRRRRRTRRLHPLLGLAAGSTGRGHRDGPDAAGLLLQQGGRERPDAADRPAAGPGGRGRSLHRSDQWVDLYEVFGRQLVTGTRIGLKMVAPLAGFRWRGDDAGGGQAMVRFAEAIERLRRRRPIGGPALDPRIQRGRRTRHRRPAELARR